ERVNLRDDAPPGGEVVVANLMRPLLLRLAPRIAAAPPRAAIVSGLLDDEADEVVAALGAVLAERRRISRRGWTTVLLTRPEAA
ncbi:MAG: 50S ribosomal protein L11 methyltransferase, partial [Thermoleophilaceae bacterium]|nr:50S ribosomal protein L11 methyltransferase [Thermoleophilaceae bacterium]